MLKLSQGKIKSLPQILKTIYNVLLLIGESGLTLAAYCVGPISFGGSLLFIFLIKDSSIFWHLILIPATIFLWITTYFIRKKQRKKQNLKLPKDKLLNIEIAYFFYAASFFTLLFAIIIENLNLPFESRFFGEDSLVELFFDIAEITVAVTLVTVPLLIGALTLVFLFAQILKPAIAALFKKIKDDNLLTLICYTTGFGVLIFSLYLPPINSLYSIILDSTYQYIKTSFSWLLRLLIGSPLFYYFYALKNRSQFLEKVVGKVK